MAVDTRRPVFLIQIVDASHPYDVVRLPGGGTLERDLTQLIASKLLAQGVTAALIRDMSDLLIQNVLKRRVGFWRTEAHVESALVTGVRETFDAYPSHDGAVSALVHQAIADAIMDIKRESTRAAL